LLPSGISVSGIESWVLRGYGYVQPDREVVSARTL
jgi:hypothetical protein